VTRPDALARRWRLAVVLVLAGCALAPSLRAPTAPVGDTRHVEWPADWEGRPLRPLALSPVEERFARGFPGRIARLTDGEQVLVWRHVERPTRMLHPAADCFRGLGYRIDAIRLEHDAQQRRWRCFEAGRPGQRWRVCERIVDADGQSYTDASSWFWAAQLGQSTGPWQAITTARPL
jgi:hypothetical protein